MVSSRTLIVTAFLVIAQTVQAMNQSPSASASSSPRSGSPAANVIAAEKRARDQQIYNVALLQFYLDHPPKKLGDQQAFFNGLCTDIDKALRGASMRSNTQDYKGKLCNLRAQAEKQLEHLKKEANAAHKDASAKKPRLKLRQLGDAHGGRAKPSLPPTPPLQQLQAVILPVVANVQPAAALAHKQQKKKKQSSIQAARAK